jgi:hypothetical protein
MILDDVAQQLKKKNSTWKSCLPNTSYGFILPQLFTSFISSQFTRLPNASASLTPHASFSLTSPHVTPPSASPHASPSGISNPQGCAEGRQLSLSGSRFANFLWEKKLGSFFLYKSPLFYLALLYHSPSRSNRFSL